MFTGLVESIGTIAAVAVEASGRRLTVQNDDVSGDLVLGESVAINGCCLTVVSKTGATADFQAGPETLSKTNLGKLCVGDRVNLERAVLATARLGGHLVQGHVDGVATIQSRRRQGEWETVWFHSGALTREMIPKGSVAVDGVSLTVVDVTADSFSVALIPHTLDNTTLGRLPVGAVVNIETDVIGKYVLKFVGRLFEGVTIEKLRSAGIIS